jgi:hypothetical protein
MNPARLMARGICVVTSAGGRRQFSFFEKQKKAGRCWLHHVRGAIPQPSIISTIHNTVHERYLTVGPNTQCRTARRVLQRATSATLPGARPEASTVDYDD